MEKIDKAVSYYDTKDKDKYLADDKNLKKIRSKNLREFCKFYLAMKEAPLVLSLFKDMDYMKTQGQDFAGVVLSKIKSESHPDKEELEKIAVETGRNVRWVTKRTLYDYMNACKFILAAEQRTNRMMKSIVEKK